MTPRLSILLLALLLASSSVLADDVGIAEVRLIEEDAQTYSLEVDVAPSLVRTIQRPRLPDRFSFIGDTELVDLGQMYVIRFRFATDGASLGPDDDLILGWQRSGILLTAYWLDGSSQRVFFDRELVGIRVAIRALREVKVSRGALLSSGFSDAVDHFRHFGWIHVVLVLACGLVGPLRSLANLLLAFAAGHGVSLIGADLGVPGLPLSVVLVLIAIAALLIFRAEVQEKAGSLRIWPVLVVLGLLHGLGYSTPTLGNDTELTAVDLVIARFAFNTSTDLMHALLALGVWTTLVVGRHFGALRRFRPVMLRLGGGLAVALALVAAPEAISPQTAAPKRVGTVSSPGGGAGASRAVARPVDVTDPLMGFVTVTAFEVRCEWLVRVRDLQPSGSSTESGERMLLVEIQSEFKDALLDRFVSQTMVTVDGQQLSPAAQQADFVTVSTYGVSTRPEPVNEVVDNAVVGITLAYPVQDAPQTATVGLHPYPADVPAVPVALADPWGSTPHRLTIDNSGFEWQRRMAGFRRPSIQAVTVPPPTIPFVSIALLIIAGLVLVYVARRREDRSTNGLVSLCCAAAIMVYPFLRAPAPDILSSRAPSEDVMQDAMTQLLTNIYRAFDYRTEDAIYDRLEVSATGDQLASIYLQHIRAMELENRGGARASVDNVEVSDVDNITTTEGGLSVEANWTVSGSVSHFGHTHYRKNNYRAAVTIVVEDGDWKISGIEIIEEERVL